MAEKGYDFFIASPGEMDEMKCKVCNSTCIVSRDQLGPTSFASALANQEALHDEFKCPNADKMWHQAALELIKAIEATPSKRIANLMQLDLDDILDTNIKKKKNYL